MITVKIAVMAMAMVFTTIMTVMMVVVIDGGDDDK